MVFPLFFVEGESKMAKIDIQGYAAHDQPAIGNPLRNGGRAATANPAAVANNDIADFITTTVGAQVVRPFSIPELDWNYACPAAITGTTDNTLNPAGGVGIRNYLTALHLINTSATPTEFVVKDGPTVIFRGYLPANMNSMMDIQFPTPLKGNVNLIMTIAFLTAANVYVNAQGYRAP